MGMVLQTTSSRKPMCEFWHEHGTLTEQVYPGMAHSINMPEMRDIQRFLETNGFIRPQIW